jgi:glutathione S-transferase
MRLDYSPGSCALSPHIVSREAGLPVELSKVTFSAEGRTTEQCEDFFQVNPKGGYVHTLRLDDDSILTEGPAIVQYLADQAPDKNLAPAAGTMERYRLAEWLAFISSELHKGFGPFFRPDLSESEKTAAADKLKKRYAYAEGALAGKDYLLGSFSVADAYLYTILRWSPRAGIELKDYANLAAFMGRMEGRAGVRTALSEEGLEPTAA